MTSLSVPESNRIFSTLFASDVLALAPSFREIDPASTATSKDEMFCVTWFVNFGRRCGSPQRLSGVTPESVDRLSPTP